MAPFPRLSGLNNLVNPAATKTIPATLLHHLLPRQTQTAPATTITIVTGTTTAASPPDNNANSATTLTGGAIAGIVIGSIAGFLLLVWIIRSCTNLGAPPGEDAVPGRPWYGGVRDEYPPRHVHPTVVEGGRGRSRSRHSYRSQHSHHSHHGGGSRRSSRREVAEVVPVTEVAPVVVRRERSPGYYGYGYGERPVRGGSRSRSRGRY